MGAWRILTQKTLAWNLGKPTPPKSMLSD
jgi:hypothetical protein